MIKNNSSANEYTYNTTRTYLNWKLGAVVFSVNKAVNGSSGFLS